MANKFKLGFRQRRWLKMLETTRRKQSRGQLYDGAGYCCLGIACLAEGVKLSTADNPRLGAVSGYSSGLTKPVRKTLKLRTTFGDTNASDRHSLIVLNDDDRLSFKEIAAEIRKHPSAYFTGPA